MHQINAFRLGHLNGLSKLAVAVSVSLTLSACNSSSNNSDDDQIVDPGPGTVTSTETVTTTETVTATDTATSTGSETETDTDTSSDTVIVTVTDTDTATDTGSNTDTGSSTDTDTGSATDSDTDVATACPASDDLTLISIVQGIGDDGSAAGQTVTIEGIVTGLDSNGFFIQEEASDYDEDANTSEGVYVSVSDDVETEFTKGSVYRLTGEVSENHGNTQLTLTEVLDCEISAELPEAITIPMPFEGVLDLESVEGMYVDVEEALVTDVNGLSRYGQLALGTELRSTPTDIAAPLTEEYDAVVAMNASNMLFVEDNISSQNPDGLTFLENFGYENTIRLGDKISTAGPLNYAYGEYRISATDPSVTTILAATIPEAPVLTSGDITIASFNVLNYFNGRVVASGDLDELDVVPNGGYETWGDGLPGSWNVIDSGITVTQSTDQVLEGNSSASVDVTTGSQGNTDFRQTINVTAGTSYRFSVNVYHTEGGVRARLYIGGYGNYSDPSVLNEWQELTGDYEATEDGTLEIGVRFYDNSSFDGSEVVYLDDFTAYDLASGTETTVTYEDNGRGVSDEDGFLMQQARIVEALADINADVVGLLELENDGFGESSAIQSLVTAINTELTERGEEELYSFVNPGGEKIGTDEITVGTIYKADAVALTNTSVIDIPDQVVNDTVEGRMRDSLIATFSYKDGADTFTIVTNHFKSKGSGCWEDEQDSVSEQDEIQGSCNAFRVSGVLAVAEALFADETVAEKIFLLGDLNAYSKEDPIAVLTNYDPETYEYEIVPANGTPQAATYADGIPGGVGFEMLAEELDPDSHSYIYDGQVGSLDHILASPAASEAVLEMEHWNINSSETGGFFATSLYRYYRSPYHRENYVGVSARASSDHDPVVISVELNELVDF